MINEKTKFPISAPSSAKKRKEPENLRVVFAREILAEATKLGLIAN